MQRVVTCAADCEDRSCMQAVLLRQMSCCDAQHCTVTLDYTSLYVTNLSAFIFSDPYQCEIKS